MKTANGYDPNVLVLTSGLLIEGELAAGEDERYEVRRRRSTIGRKRSTASSTIVGKALDQFGLEYRRMKRWKEATVGADEPILAQA